MLKNILELLAATPTEIMNAAEKELTRIGYAVSRDHEDLFIFAVPPQFRGEGADEIEHVFTPLLCSHVDVVGVNPPKKEDLIVDESQNKISLSPKSKSKVLGADDRAGIFAMFQILGSLKNHLPFVVLTDGEEVGGIGAGALADSELLLGHKENISCFIELDRRGAGEFVSYDLSGEPNKELRVLFEEQGFTLGHGSYSDVADFTPITGASNVNLSVGYRHEHSQQEVLFLDELELTVSRVLRMWAHCPTLFLRTFEAEEGFDDWGNGYEIGNCNWDYREYDRMMNSLYQLSADAALVTDVPALVREFLVGMESKVLDVLVENLEEVVDDLNYSDSDVDRQISDALVDILVLGENEEEEEGEDELDFLECPDGFCENKQGIVVGRSMNRAGGF